MTSAICLMIALTLLTGCHRTPSKAYVTRFRVEDTPSNRIAAIGCIKAVAESFGFINATNRESGLCKYESPDGLLGALPDKADHTLFTNDITNLASLSFKLKHPQDSDLVSQYIRRGLSSTVLAMLSNYDGGPNAALQKALSDSLIDMIVTKESIFNSDRFSGVVLSERTKKLLGQKLAGAENYQLNRLLLSDAYPGEIRALPPDTIAIYYENFMASKSKRYVTIAEYLGDHLRVAFGTNIARSEFDYSL
jgi:hypothetical protein